MSLSKLVELKYQTPPISNRVFHRRGVSFTQNITNDIRFAFYTFFYISNSKMERAKITVKWICVVSKLGCSHTLIIICARHIRVSVVKLPTYSLSINLNERRMCHSRILSPFLFFTCLRTSYYFFFLFTIVDGFSDANAANTYMKYNKLRQLWFVCILSMNFLSCCKSMNFREMQQCVIA